MFRRKTPPLGSPKPESTGLPELTVPPMPEVAPAAQPAPPPPRPTFSEKGAEMNIKSPTAAPPASTAASGNFKPEIPRRVVEIPGSPARRPTGAELAGGNAADLRRLIVGRDISLSGEITACDVLVVEGMVEAKLRDGRSIEIAESGLFKGSVEIDDADIGGRFEGDLLVRGRLRVRSTGRIHGSIKYGELEVEAGGQLVGDVQVLGPAAPVAKIAPPESASAGASVFASAAVRPGAD